MVTKSRQDEVIELANKLFIYTDSRQWDALQRQVFSDTVFFDMESLGAGPRKEMASRQICEMWKTGFEGIDQVHHQAGNFIVDFTDENTNADIFCYAIAIHYKNSATQGKTREFVGSYKLHATLTDIGWRLNSFTYLLKYSNGNVDFK
jgi:hypothetical protein